jgi:PAS domain S-box-containing protein
MDSPLGPPDAWPASLKTTVGLILPAQAQIVLFWGPEFVALYNDAYAPAIGDKHPHALGRPARETWAELWDELEPLLSSVRETGETVAGRDRAFAMERHGYAEPVSFDLSFSPVRGAAGEVEGVLGIVLETTDRVAALRRSTDSEARRAFLLELTDATRLLDDPSAIVGDAARRLGERLGASRVGYAEVEVEADRATILGAWSDGSVAPLPPQIRLSDFGAPLIARLMAGGTLRVDDTRANEVTRESLDALDGIAARALVSVPLFRDGRFLVNLNVHQSAPRTWTDSEVALIEEVAERTWAAVERVRLDAAQRASQRELQTLADTLPVLVSYMDADRRYRFVNQAYERWFPSRTREAVVGLPVREVIGEEAYAAVSPYMDRVLAGEPVSFEQFMPYAEGPHRQVHVDYVPRLEGERVIGFYALVTDISEAKRAEAQLRESEARYRQIVEGAEDFAILQMDEHGVITAWNTGAENITGFRRDEAIGRPGAFIFTPEDRAAGVPDHEMNRATEQERAINERWHLRKDGSRFWGSGLLMRLEGAQRGFLKMFRDRTAEHMADVQLRESEARFRNMADHAPVMMWVTDETGSCTYLNQAWYDFTGQTPEEAEKAGWLDATHPDDKAEAERMFLEANAEQRAFRLEYRLRRRDGAFRWAIDAASPRFGRDGQFLGYIGSVIDIDERHEAEQALQVSEERLRLATEAAELGFWDVDIVHDRLIWPPRVKEMFGIHSGRPVTLDDFYEGLHPEDRDATAEAFARACDPGLRALYDVEYRTVGHEDGVVRWVAAKGRGLFDEAGSCHRVVGTAIDITARKQAEIALRESESRLRFLGELDEALRTVRDPFQAMEAATRLLAQRLDVTRCAYADVDDDNDTFFIRADYSAPGVPSSAGEYSLDLFGPRAAADMRQGRTLIVRDVPGELAPGEGREMFQAIGIDAIICCPLVKDGKLRAMMAVHNAEARAWRADEIALVETVVERCWAQIERVGAEARLRESEERYRTLFTSIESGFCEVEVALEGRIDYRVVEANPAFYRQTGFPEDVLGRWLREAAPDLEEHWFERYASVARTGEAVRFEEGSPSLGRWFDVYAFRVGEPDERRVAILFNDISARRNAEEALRELNATLEERVVERTAELEAAHEQLRQSQKMEAVGQLGSGVAHDFNNLLTPIVGALDLLQRKELGGPREQRLIAGAAQSADRAKTLVQRLLAFARRQPLQSVPVDVAQLVEGMAELIGSTTGPQIRIVVDAAPGLPPAKADPNQLEMALLNLAVNARDAMPDGGTLRISATAERATAGAVPGLSAGNYIRLSVADTGVGMNADTLARAIEPFFSTKGIGRGTGLGLSMVHGLASQLGGALNITSKVGIGTNIELWLPQTSDRPVEEAQAAAGPESLGRRGTALLVDDEELVRMSTADMLEDLGYRVIEAASSEEALAIVERGDAFDLLVTDHLMPGMTGTELARRTRLLRGALPVLIVSGYAESEGLAPDLPRLTKPFRKDELAASLAGVAGTV